MSGEVAVIAGDEREIYQLLVGLKSAMTVLEHVCVLRYCRNMHVQAESIH